MKKINNNYKLLIKDKYIAFMIGISHTTLINYKKDDKQQIRYIAYKDYYSRLIQSLDSDQIDHFIANKNDFEGFLKNTNTINQINDMNHNQNIEVKLLKDKKNEVYALERNLTKLLNDSLSDITKTIIKFQNSLIEKEDETQNIIKKFNQKLEKLEKKFPVKIILFN